MALMRQRMIDAANRSSTNLHTKSSVVVGRGAVPPSASKSPVRLTNTFKSTLCLGSPPEQLPQFTDKRPISPYKAQVTRASYQDSNMFNSKPKDSNTTQYSIREQYQQQLKKVSSPKKVSKTFLSNVGQDKENQYNRHAFERKSTMQPSASTTRLEKNWSSTIFNEASAVQPVERGQRNQGPNDAGKENMFGDQDTELRGKYDRQFYNLQSPSRRSRQGQFTTPISATQKQQYEFYGERAALASESRFTINRKTELLHNQSAITLDCIPERRSRK